MDRWEVKMKKTFFFLPRSSSVYRKLSRIRAKVFGKRKPADVTDVNPKAKKRLKLIIRRWLVCNSIAEVQATLSRHISVPEVANSKRMYFSFAQKTLSFLIQHKLREVSGPRNVFFIHVGFFNYWPPALHLIFRPIFFFSLFSLSRDFEKLFNFFVSCWKWRLLWTGMCCCCNFLKLKFKAFDTS